MKYTSWVDCCVKVYDGRTAQLGIREVYAADVGSYECVARNSHGKVAASCRLTIIGGTFHLEFVRHLVT